MTKKQIIVIPPTTTITIVFPFDEPTKRFDCSFYSPHLTDGRASIQEIQQVLAEVEAIRGSLASEGGCMGCLRLLCFLFISSLMIIALNNVDVNDSSSIPFVAIGCFVLMVSVCCCMSKRDERINNEIKERCQAAVDKHNYQSFGSRGLRWHIPIHFPRWIELWKDYQGQSSSNMYIPPPPQV